ncbi:hypothetical protein BDZ89DRAFT_916297, partial [Hymenopellis radicata]
HSLETVCRDFIQALDDCHLNFVAKMTGGCNRQKNELNACLRKERVARHDKNREASKVRRAKQEAAIRAFYD